MNRTRSGLLVSLFALVGCRLEEPAAVRQVDWTTHRWVLLPTPTQASLRGLAVVDERVAWLGGAGGTLLRTVDGGRSWHDVAPPASTDCDFRDVEAMDEHSALAMVAGQPARVHRTTDGGRTWQIVHDDARPAAFFDAMAFRGNFGVLFGDPVDGVFTVLTSRDAGRTWAMAQADLLPRPLPGEAAFAASGTCVACLDGTPGGRPCIVTGGSATRFLLGTGDAGAWTAIDLPLQRGSAARGAFSVAFRRGGLERICGVVVGGDYEDPGNSDGSAAFTEDGGRSWQAAAGGAGGYRSSVAWLDDTHVIAVGSHGVSLSADGGRSWQAQQGPGFHAVGVGRDGSVWACGSDGRVARFLPQP